MYLVLSIIALIARIFCGSILAIAGFSKVRAGELSFTKAIIAYELLPVAGSRIVAQILPYLELSVGICLLLGLMLKIVSVAGIIVFCMMTGAVALALLQKKKISCGCGGKVDRSRPIRWMIVRRNIALIFSLVFIFFTPAQILAFDALLAHSGVRAQSILALSIVFLVSFVTYPRKSKNHQVGIAQEVSTQSSETV